MSRALPEFGTTAEGSANGMFSHHSGSPPGNCIRAGFEHQYDDTEATKCKFPSLVSDTRCLIPSQFHFLFQMSSFAMSVSSVLSSRPQSVQSKGSPIFHTPVEKVKIPGIGIASQVIADIE